MSKRPVSTQRRGGVVAVVPPAVHPAPRISGISYTLGPDHAFVTRATYRYEGGRSHSADIRVDPHRYELFCAVVEQQQGHTAGPEEVAALLHDLFYCLYAPPPITAPALPQTGAVPDRP